MLVIGVLLEVQQLSYTNFGFVMMITIVVLEVPRGSMQLVGPLCLLYSMCKKGIISLKMR
jgi:hypothetical protein